MDLTGRRGVERPTVPPYVGPPSKGNIYCNQGLNRMKFCKTTPILRIFDECKAKEFYLNFLGFQVDWEHRFAPNLPLYFQVSRGECVLHLSEHHSDCCPGAALRIETTELEEFLRELGTKNYTGAHPTIETMPWGTHDLTVTDPFGNRLVFTNAISINSLTVAGSGSTGYPLKAEWI